MANALVGSSGCGLEIAQPLMGHPFQQFRNRPGGHAVQIGAALLDHRGDHGQRVHLFERAKQPFGDIRVGLITHEPHLAPSVPPRARQQSMAWTAKG